MPDLTKPDHTLVAVLEDGQARVLRVPTAYDPERRRMRPVIEPAPGRRVFWRGAEILADGTAVPGPSPWWGPWSAAYSDYSTLKIPTPQPVSGEVPQTSAGNAPRALDRTKQCGSNWDCPSALYCLKAPGSNRGTCVQNVNEFGTRQFERPDSNSFDRGVAQCEYSTDCPIGFRCDSKLKACMKN